MVTATQLKKPVHIGERILRVRETSKATGLPISSIYALIATGDFPAPIKLSLRRVGWVASEVDQWIARRIDQGRTKKA